MIGGGGDASIVPLRWAAPVLIEDYMPALSTQLYHDIGDGCYDFLDRSR